MGQRLAEKVLLVGWDAADWKMIRPMLDKGWMPTLQRLIEGGVSGNLATIRPILSPMLWNSIATGKRADKHGICGFMEPKPDGSGIRPVTSTSRKCKAIWNILSQSGLRSNVVSWFASAPPEPINGSVVTDQYAALCKVPPDKRKPGPGLCHPPELRDKLMELIVDPTLLDGEVLAPFVPEGGRVDQSTDDRIMQLAMLISRMSTVQAAAHYLMYRDDWDFTAIYFDAIDHFGHTFMPYHPPQMDGIKDEDALIYRDVMTGVYRFQDMMLDATLRLAGEDTTVIIVSDHGFHNDAKRPSTNGMEDPEGWHSPYGIACLYGPGIKQNETLYGATLLDVTPTILALFGLPIGADMDGRPWLEVLDQPVQPERVLSWDAIPGESGMLEESEREDPVAAAEAIRQLVELGYIEDPGDDAEKAIRNTVRDMKHNLARALEDSKRAHLALPIWEELAEMESEHGDYFKLQVTRSYMRQGQFEKMEQYLKQHFQPEQLEHPTFVMQFGDAYLAQGKLEQAQNCYEQVYQAYPKSTAILQRLGTLYCQMRNWDEADRVLHEVLDMEGDNALAYNDLSEVCIARGDYALAVEYALKAVDLFHYFPRAHRNLGQALAEMGMTEQAILALETSLTMEPNHRGAHLWLAKLYRRDSRDLERAAKHEVYARRSNLSSK
ncbi:MAG: hypothetical protein Kow00105_03340 [Phycisphaeraceae bacterium]